LNKLVSVLLLIIIAFIGYEMQLVWVSIIAVLLLIFIVLGSVLRGTARAGYGIAREGTRDMMNDMEEAEPKPPEGEYLAELTEEAAKKFPELKESPENRWTIDHKTQRIHKGSKGLLEGIQKLFRKKFVD